jgi:hypothetical protein
VAAAEKKPAPVVKQGTDGGGATAGALSAAIADTLPGIATLAAAGRAAK